MGTYEDTGGITTVDRYAPDQKILNSWGQCIEIWGTLVVGSCNKILVHWIFQLEVHKI